MLPISYQMPAAVVLLVFGLAACLAGFRLLLWVLAAFGFIIGGLAASSILGTGDTAYMAGAFLLGGLAGAVIMVAASFIGVALVGAGLGALAVTLVWSRWTAIRIRTSSCSPRWPAPGWPPGCSATSPSSARPSAGPGRRWSASWPSPAISAKLAAAAAGDVWVPYPMQPAPGQAWVPWVVARARRRRRRGAALRHRRREGGRVVKARKKSA